MKSNAISKDLVYNKSFPTVVLIDSVELLDGYRVHLKFTDGTEKDIDLQPILSGPVFEKIRNEPAYFRQVFVDPLSKTLTWPNGVDLDPESLYYGDQEPPWWSEYKEQKKKKARQLRERKARKLKTARRAAVKPKVRKKAAAKPTARKTVLAKKK
jgi:hypothetical protein